MEQIAPPLIHDSQNTENFRSSASSRLCRSENEVGYRRTNANTAELEFGICYKFPLGKRFNLRF